MGIRSVRRRMRSLVRRDTGIAKPTGEPNHLALVGHQHSFYLLHRHYRRALQFGKAQNLRQPIWALNPKLRAYEFARSHGVDLPASYGRYAHVSELPWDELPPAFVLKTDGGSTAEGVLPLVRREGKYLDLLNTKRGLRRPDEIVGYLDGLTARKKVSAELIVEELLFSPHRDDDETLAPDVKLYCFYGEVGMILCRLTNGTRDHHHFSYRYFDEKGNDLGDALVGHGNVDADVPAPLHLAELIDASSRMSVALKVPFVRLDFYERKDSIVFGEITPSPGGEQQPRADLDDRFGQMWKRAEVQLMHDLNRTGVFNPDFGTAQTP